jgi:hypothetical protein
LVDLCFKTKRSTPNYTGETETVYNLQETELEWSLKHLLRFYSSDFFPKPFEFEAIKADWPFIRQELLKLDLATYVPKTPLSLLAPKANGCFRVVHQIDPLDALIYTALVKQEAGIFEAYRIPQSEAIACSYRIMPDLDGSFFDSSEDGWSRFNERTRALTEQYTDGFVLICDFVDFYNQIYTHRLRNVIAESGGSKLEEYARVVERFLHGLNDNTSRGIPVGPAASIVLAEVVLSDIDRKVLSHTSSFVRWVDDFRIFFKTIDEVQTFLHEFTKYLYEVHRLVLSGEKTGIFSVNGARSPSINRILDQAFYEAWAPALVHSIFSRKVRSRTEHSTSEESVQGATLLPGVSTFQLNRSQVRA